MSSCWPRLKARQLPKRPRVPSAPRGTRPVVGALANCAALVVQLTPSSPTSPPDIRGCRRLTSVPLCWPSFSPRASCSSALRANSSRCWSAKIISSRSRSSRVSFRAFTVVHSSWRAAFSAAFRCATWLRPMESPPSVSLSARESASAPRLCPPTLELSSVPSPTRLAVSSSNMDWLTTGWLRRPRELLPAITAWLMLYSFVCGCSPPCQSSWLCSSRSCSAPSQSRVRAHAAMEDTLPGSTALSTWLSSMVAPCPAYMGTSSAVRRARDTAIMPTSACMATSAACLFAPSALRLASGRLLMLRARCAHFSVFKDSSRLLSAELTHAIMAVRLLPPRESWSKRVRRESL
mmetsp:Transcript_9493/g.25599  ORF Transcript_9493/g.25599 Transcript_9493/m.25599 type:complete len:349 (-) Transcript_9493:1175-2221(-)